MTAHTPTHKDTQFVQGTPVFYGWIVWFVATIGLSATSPGQSFSVSLFIDHYIADFGLDRTSVSALYGLGTFIASLSLTWVGRRIDLHGNRVTSAVIALLFGLVLIACSLVAGPMTMLISFIAIRGLGQGSLGLSSSTAIAQWFKRRRGWVMGLSLVLYAVFQRFYLPWLQGFIEANGWRAAWVMLGAVLLIVVLPVTVLFLRNRPEDFGLEPDGKPLPADADAPVVIEENWRLGEAMRTPLFWVYAAARMLAGAWGTALVFHQISLFEGLGHTPQVAAATYGQAALMTAGFTLVSGWLVDRMQPGHLIGIQMGGLIAATGLAMIMDTSGLLFLYTAAYGIVMGVGAVFDGTVWVNLFGRQHQGAIRGFVATAMVMGTSLGPLVFGVSYDYLGSYDASIWLAMVLSAVALVAGLLVRKPTYPAAV